MGKRAKSVARPSKSPRKPSSTGRVVGSVAGRAASREAEDASGGWLARAQQEILTPTYWFDPGDQGEPYAATIRFSGRRVGSAGKLQPRDSFSQEETVQSIVPGSGPVSVTTRVCGINPGDWLVTAQAVDGPNGRVRRTEPRHPLGGIDAAPAEHTVWPGRTPPSAAGVTSPVKTALAPFARVPGVVRFAWAVLVGLGVLVGLAVQAILVARGRDQVTAALLVSLSAVAVGSVAAKAWYIAVHRARRYDGWCIQGFILGTALIAGTLPGAVLKIPVGTFLDFAAPGLLFGLVIGRPGCFLAGCCCGRPTTSRWGLWSSDQCVGMRRIPTQLMEASLCLAIGVAALILILGSEPGRPGAVFVGALAAYTLGRQFLLPWRAEPRQTSIGRPLTIGVAALVLAADIVIASI